MCRTISSIMVTHLTNVRSGTPGWQYCVPVQVRRGKVAPLTPREAAGRQGGRAQEVPPVILDTA